MTLSFDILGPGCVAVDDLLFVAEYPAADSKMPIERRQRQCGGLGGTSLVTASRLGCHCAYAGILGDDDLSCYVLRCFQREGIDLRYVRHRGGARPIHSIIVIDQSRQTRTILFDLDGFCPVEPDWPPEQAIRAARVLLVDHCGTEGMLRAARIARAAGVAVVADFEGDEDPRFGELAALADHLVLSRDFAARMTGQWDAATAARRLWSPERAAVVVTCGAEGCWYLDAAHCDRPQHQAAFPVEAVDTTGCGDVFHGAYAASLVWGLDLAERIRFASATAGLKAMRPGGQAGIPTRAAVEAFLEERGT